MDRNIFMGIVAATIVLVLIVGDIMYIGIWYYLAIPIAAFIVTAFFKPSSFFLTGIGLAIFITYIPYYWRNLTATNLEGLLGLGHLSSLPGLFIGIIFSAVYLKSKNKSVYFTAGFGFSVSLMGYAINQLIICNSLMYCGSLLSRINS